MKPVKVTQTVSGYLEAHSLVVKLLALEQWFEVQALGNQRWKFTVLEKGE